MELLPGKPLTRDQLLMLQQDNVVSADMPGLQELGIVPTPVELVVPAYLRRFQPGGGSAGVLPEEQVGAPPICHCRRRLSVTALGATRGGCDKRTAMRTLYHLPLSPFSRKVRLVLAEKRLPFDLRTEKVWERRADYLELNPAGTVPTLVEDNGLAIADSGVICEYLEEAYPDTPLLGRTLAERVEARRLVAWFDGKFAAEATRNLFGEKVMKRMAGRGNPDAAAMRTGYLALRYHLEYLGWLAETRKWLAGSAISLADFTAAAHLSCLDFIGDVDWIDFAGGEGLVRADEVAPELPRRAGGSRARHDARRRTTPTWISEGRRPLR